MAERFEAFSNIEVNLRRFIEEQFQQSNLEINVTVATKLALQAIEFSTHPCCLKATHLSQDTFPQKSRVLDGFCMQLYCSSCTYRKQLGSQKDSVTSNEVVQSVELQEREQSAAEQDLLFSGEAEGQQQVSILVDELDNAQPHDNSDQQRIDCSPQPMSFYTEELMPLPQHDTSASTQFQRLNSNQMDHSLLQKLQHKDSLPSSIHPASQYPLESQATLSLKNFGTGGGGGHHFTSPSMQDDLSLDSLGTQGKIPVNQKQLSQANGGSSLAPYQGLQRILSNEFSEDRDDKGWEKQNEFEPIPEFDPNFEETKVLESQRPSDAPSRKQGVVILEEEEEKEHESEEEKEIFGKKEEDSLEKSQPQQLSLLDDNIQIKPYPEVNEPTPQFKIQLPLPDSIHHVTIRAKPLSSFQPNLDGVRELIRRQKELRSFPRIPSN